MTSRELSPAASPMQPELFRGCPGPPVVVRHLDMGRAEEREGVVYRIGETRHAADIWAFADAFGPDRMVRRPRCGTVEFPVRRFDRRRQEVIHERGGGDVALLVVVDLLAHRDAEG